MFNTVRLVCGAVFIVLGAVMLGFGLMYVSAQPLGVWVLGVLLMLLGIEEMYSAAESNR